jgi:hypothetical protein
VFTLTYSYSRPLLRRYYFHELWRTQGGWLLSLPLAIAVVIWASLDPQYWWFAGFLGGLSLAYVLLLYGGYKHLGHFPIDEPMTTTITETGQHFDSALVVSDVLWTAIRAVRHTHDGLILTSRITLRPVFLPSAVLTQEITAFVVREGSRGEGDA